MGIAIGDWTTTEPQTFSSPIGFTGNALFHNLRAKLGDLPKAAPLFFGDIAEMVGLGRFLRNSIGWGTSFFDYDNDGQLDLFVVNGSTFQDDKDPRHLLPMKNFCSGRRNPKDGFYEVGALSGAAFEQARVGRGAALADYDNDGDIDVFIVNQEGRPMCLRNDGGNKRTG